MFKRIIQRYILLPPTYTYGRLRRALEGHASGQDVHLGIRYLSRVVRGLMIMQVENQSRGEEYEGIVRDYRRFLVTWYRNGHVDTDFFAELSARAEEGLRASS